jgi:hypothetical protein
MALLICYLLVLVLAVLFAVHISKKKSENICGGMDKCCNCDGNEMMVVKRISDDDLTRIASGMHVL